MYFFTINLQDRNSDLLVENIDSLKEAFKQAKAKHPFDILAMVVLPDHLHMIMSLPEGESNFSVRIQSLKASFSRRIPKATSAEPRLRHRGERGIWQRRFWEHLIRDEEDLENHANYIHFNPVKHGYVSRPADWPQSSFHGFVARGWRQADWGVKGWGCDMDLE